MNIKPVDIAKPLRVMSGQTDGLVREALRAFASTRLTNQAAPAFEISKIPDRRKDIVVETVQLSGNRLPGSPSETELDQSPTPFSRTEFYIVNDGELQKYSVASDYIETIPVV